jgi:uncharacterized protein (UPF0216 family)
MSRSRFKVLELDNIESVEDATRILLKQHVNVLLNIFGDDINMISKEALAFYFAAAAKLLLRKQLGITRRKICEKIIKTFAQEKMSGVSRASKGNFNLLKDMSRFKKLVRRK